MASYSRAFRREAVV